MRGAGEGLEGHDLVLEEHVVDGILELDSFDDLDADRRAILVVDALVHGAAVALPDVLADLVGIGLDGLHHLVVINQYITKQTQSCRHLISHY